MDIRDDLDVIWAKLVQDYSQITNQHLPADADLLSIQHGIDTALNRSASENKARAKKIMANVGQCVQRFGDIIASAASIAFGPSAQCMNAISFVISAAMAYQEMLDGFVTLMERSMAFLSRLNMFLEERKAEAYLPIHLRGPAYEFLGHFLRVLANSYKVANSKAEKFKKFAKVVLFNDDSGVKADLQLMEKIVSDLLNIEIDEILRDVKGLARYLQDSEQVRQRHHGEIMENLKQTDVQLRTISLTAGRVDDRTQQIKQMQDHQISQQAHEKALKKIRETIPVDVTDSWSEHHKKLQGIRLPGTGEWLSRLAPYVEWSNFRQDALPTMVLTGSEGYGKSILCSHIVDRLIDQSQTSSEHEVFVAWYYFHQDTDLYSTVEECLGSLIYQLANANPTYASALAQVCRSTADLGRAEQIWAKLVTELEAYMGGTYFLVIDGYSAVNLEPNAAKVMAALARGRNASSKLRAFISSPDIDFGDVADVHISLGVDSGESRSRFNQSLSYTQSTSKRLGAINGVAINNADLLLLSKTRLDVLCESIPDLKPILQGGDSDAASTLVSGVGGDYRLLLSKINEIKTSDTARKVINILKSAGEDRIQSLTRIIDNLNATLRSDEIQEVNELLIWVIDACGSKTVSLLQAAILLKTNESYQLRKQLNDIFSSVLRLTENDEVELVFRAEDLRSATSMRSNADRESSASGDSTQVVQKCEIEIVQHFLRVNCRPDLYLRLGFDDFFKDALSRHSKAICVDSEVENHTRLAELCLDVLGMQEDNTNYRVQLEPIRVYAAKWFLEHLLKIDPQLVDRTALRRIGGKIANLLWDAASIDNWWSSDLLWYLTMDWLSTDENADQLLAFLSQPSVAAGFKTAHEKDVWLRATIIEKGSSLRLLSRVASRLASNWMLGLSQDFSCFARAERIMSHVWNESDTQIFNYAMPTPEQLDHFMPWLRAHQALTTISEPSWNLKVAEIFARYGTEPLAIKALSYLAQVEQEHPGDAAAMREQARAHFKLSAYTRCLECIERLETNGEDQSLSGSVAMLKLNLMRARCYRNIDIDTAIIWFRHVLGAAKDLQDSENVHAVVNDSTVELFECLNMKKMYDVVAAEVMSWRSVDGKLDRRLLRISSSDSSSDMFEEFVLEAVYYTGRWKEFLALYGELGQELQNSSSKADKLQAYRLQVTGATLLYYCSDKSFDQDRALDIWEQLIAVCPVNDSNQTVYHAAVRLGNALYDRLTRHSMDISNANAERLLRLNEHLETVGRTYLHSILARLYHAAGEPERARSILQHQMGDILDNWSNEQSEAEVDVEFLRIGRALSPIDDDINIIAPYHRRHYTQYGRSDISLFDCRGCHRTWKDASDLYICKQCKTSTDYVLCSSCYDRLQSGELKLPPWGCNKDHPHLYIPPIDVEKRNELEPDRMFVGGEVVETAAWLDGLRAQWNLDLQPAEVQSRELERKKQQEASGRKSRWWRYRD